MSYVITRRSLLGGTGLAVAAVTGSSLLAGCSDTSGGSGSGGIPVKDVPVGSAYIQQNGDYVVIQPTAGHFRAFSRVCPHAGCKVNKVEGDNIVCPCHGSRYSVVDGSRVSGPTPRGLTEVPVKVDGKTLEVG
ncbi:Ferredoxin subunit of nitrite reductase or a ring-hydroxylating dioxygenase [Raineyella antarctica]|uniref:Cytochrome bc1 complex Rieske iron-sulfur subunit n=1 Tax=Raineyella antarctica TaxID=1577474 RepID=A0A1G6GMS6_9ACTN|nr:Rieske (2Fe-2S) protein [Raineyella antarctica]SDB83143.1 Ferredoxin subunit of nitrite reductase or a ring-hydroxylating dioxygenase [Raineyella antarctica]